MADPKALTALSAETRFSYSDNAVTVPELKLQLDETSINGKLSLPSLSPLAANFNVAVDRINLDRYLPPPSDAYTPLGTGAEDDGAGLERLDPVCLMDVDPAMARWKSEYNGRTYYFCAPGCKKAFEREPQAYI